MRRGGGTQYAKQAAWTAYAGISTPFQRRFPFRSPAAIERAQRRRIRAAVTYAYRHVPHYREAMDQRALRPMDIATARDLARLPLIERHEVQRAPERFLSTVRPRDGYLALNTTGSSGEPRTIHCDSFALFRRTAHNGRARGVWMPLTGKRLRARIVAIGSPASSGHEIERVLANRSVIPLSARGTKVRLSVLDPPAENLERINALRPDVLDSYGSYLEALFAHAYETGAALHRPKAILYGSDGLSAGARRLISEHFGIPVFSVYRAVEALQIGFECEHHRGHHLNDDLYPTRIVDGDGEELPDGESGEIVVSNLINRGTVLLNYRLGDLASKRPGGCPCGRSLPMLSYVEGRVGDWLRSPSGERVHSQAVRSLFAGEADVWRYQVAQGENGDLAVSIVAAPEADREDLKRRIALGVRKKVGRDTDVEIRFVDSLSPGRGGKVPVVISRAQRFSSGE